MEAKAVEIKAAEHGLFATPVLTLNFTKDVHDMNEELVRDIAIEVKEDPDGIVKSNFNGWHSQGGLERKYDSFRRLAELVSACANNYCSNYGWETGVECSNLWANINGPGDSNHPHQHNLSSLVAVYYPIGWIDGEETFYNYAEDQIWLSPYVCDGEKGGSLALFDPCHGKRIHLNPVEQLWHTVSSMHVYPHAGLLVLFPTYLVHTVTPFKEQDRKRISISFEFSYGQGGNSDSEESAEQ